MARETNGNGVVYNGNAGPIQYGQDCPTVKEFERLEARVEALERIIRSDPILLERLRREIARHSP